MEGALEPVEEAVRGKGIPVWGYSFPRGLRLGTAPDSRRRGHTWITMPRAEGRVEAAYLSIGVVLGEGARVPFSWKLAVDGVNIAREFKPQFVVETDSGVYAKAVYDVKPVLASRLAEREDHRVFMARDAYHPVEVVDVFLFARYEGPYEYSSSYLTGAVRLEPGEVYQASARLPQVPGGNRSAGIMIHSPSHLAEFEIVIGGSKPFHTGGGGSAFLEVPFTYRGSPVPLSIRYLRPSVPIYPKHAVVSDAIIVDLAAPAPRPRIVIESVVEEDGVVVVRGKVVNEGEGEMHDALLEVSAMTVQVHRERLGTLESGGERGFEARVPLNRLPVRPSRVQVRVSWVYMARRETISEDVPITRGS